MYVVYVYSVCMVVTILSVSIANVKELMAMPDIDGCLVGGKTATYVCMYVWMNEYIQYMFTCIYVCMYVFNVQYEFMHVCLYVRIYVCMYVYFVLYIY